MTSPFRQPRAVWAVAFACVISFMGIGLVDPILPALSTQLHATPSQVTLLFTSYLVVTAVAMLVTGWVSSRIGAKNTLIAGLVLIVVFAGLAGASDTIGGIVGFRAGWGLGNALFIATSLAVIVGSATRRVRGRDRPLRDGARHRHRLRPAAGRRCSATSAGAARSSGSPCSWRSRSSRPLLFVPRTPAPGRACLALGAAQGAAPPRAAHHGPHGPALQLGLLHDARLRAVPDAPVDLRARRGLLRLGPAGGGVLGVRRAAAAAPASAPPRPSTSTWRCSPSCSP